MFFATGFKTWITASINNDSIDFILEEDRFQIRPSDFSQYEQVFFKSKTSGQRLSIKNKVLSSKK